MYTEVTSTQMRTNEKKVKRKREKQRRLSCRRVVAVAVVKNAAPRCCQNKGRDVFPRCSCLIRRDLMNFWERLLQDPLKHPHLPPHLPPHCPTPYCPPTSILLFLPFLFEAEESSPGLRGRSESPILRRRDACVKPPDPQRLSSHCVAAASAPE